MVRLPVFVSIEIFCTILGLSKNRILWISKNIFCELSLPGVLIASPVIIISKGGTVVFIPMDSHWTLPKNIFSNMPSINNAIKAFVKRIKTKLLIMAVFTLLLILVYLLSQT